ncbi:copper resistance D family protein [Bacillus sp. FJAT-26390]|uniref:copper resistance D family protein n=1 Tax=Bacillus sp. FJAT-26390 TaxID=1743142 RepID=UPI0008082144|nr:CopD family protein [Bacillus sp. FJAT-26390]
MDNIRLRTNANLTTYFKRINYLSYLAFGMLVLFLTLFSSLLIPPQQALAQPAASQTSFDPHKQVGHNHSESAAIEEGITVQQVLFFVVRAVYYFAFMLAAGFMLWSIAFADQTSDTARKLANKWGIYTLRGLLLAVLVFVFVHVSYLLKGYEGGDQSEWIRLLTETATGQSWLALIVLSLLGFVVLKLNDSFKIIWALLLAATESFNGHVNALPNNTFAIVLDFIHIASSALWAGGLLLLLLFWRTDRKEAGRFAERFTKIAWLTILLLTVSGTLMTVLLLPSWRYLYYTNWGLMLLAKAVLVLFIGCAGFLLHRRAKHGRLPSGKLLKLDGLLMGTVLIIVSVFTYVSPIPDTEPFSYHQMGEKMHYTIGITPNGPGPNRISLKVWLPEQLGAPTSVQLLLRSIDHPQRKAIEVHLLGDNGEDFLSFPGFIETDYAASKVELPTRGEWTAELIVTDQSGAETKHLIPFRND